MRILTLILGIALFHFGCATTGARDGFYKVTVKAGDSLASIAQRFGTSWEAVARENNMNGDSEIEVGMVLRVRPGPGGHIAGSKKVRVPASQSRAKSSSGGLLFGGSASGSLAWPVRGDITSSYGRRDGRMHHGVDIKALYGTSIVAAEEGKVIFAGTQSGYGKTVVVHHGNLKTLYAHLSKIAVDKGDLVMRGEYIGKVGTSGNAQGAHLHFEVRTPKEESMDPLNKLEHSRLLSSL